MSKDNRSECGVDCTCVACAMIVEACAQAWRDDVRRQAQVEADRTFREDCDRLLEQLRGDSRR